MKEEMTLNLNVTDIMSQDEANQLLDAINGKNTKPEDYRPVGKTRKILIYDFERPNKLSAEHIRNLSIIHEAVMQSWEPLFSRYCRDNIKIEVVSVDELRYDEFLRCLPNPIPLIVSKGFVNSVAVPTPFIFTIERNIPRKLLYYIFLGKTKNIEKDKSIINNPKTFTSIEQTAMGYFGRKLLKKYSQVWGRQLGISMESRLDSLITDPQCANIVPPYEKVALISMEMKGSCIRDMINICLPYPFLKALLPNLSRKNGYKTSHEYANGKSIFVSKQMKDTVPLILKAEYFRKSVYLEDLLKIQEGDVLSAPQLHGENRCKLMIDDYVFFSGEIINDNSVRSDYRQVRVNKIINTYKEGNIMTERDVSTVETSMGKLKVQLVVELGRTVKTFEEILKIDEGSIVNLDTFANEPVSIFANNVLFANGEVVVENEKFAIRVCEILYPKPEQAQQAAEEKTANEEMAEEEGNHANI